MKDSGKILLVDDDKNLLRVVSYHIEELGFEVTPVDSAELALEAMSEESFDLVITDLRMPGIGGLELLERVRSFDSEIPVIVLTAYGTIDRAVEAVKAGAFDFLSKPFEKAEVEHAIGKALQLAHLLKENRRLARAVEEKFEFKGIVGSSKSFREVISLASQLAQVDTTVLIQGESGTGKELLARAIHFNSRRKSKPFVVINCGAIPADLIESELFGYKKGAFTGAITNKKGKFETADTGTIFLDEVGELPISMQVKLLRVIQEREVDVVGDPHPHPVDVRILAASNRELQGLMESGAFREDLFYRLSVAPLHVPPLRERREDIPILIHHILSKLGQKIDKEVEFDGSVLEILRQYDWPGNVREMENLLERLVVFNRTGRVTASDLPDPLRRPLQSVGKVKLELPDEGFSLEELEREILWLALEKNDWNQTHAAQYLDISRNTLVYRMQKFDIKKGK